MKNIKHIKDFLNESSDPWTRETYKYKVSVSFSGWDSAIFEGRLVFSKDEYNEEEMKKRIGERLKHDFNNVRLNGYDVLNIEKASDKEQIRPAM